MTRPLVIAHRGASGECPENTLAAYELAVAQSGENPDFYPLEAALARLPAKLGAPLRLKHMEGMSYDEISGVLGIGVSAAKMRVSRARRQLAEILNHEN